MTKNTTNVLVLMGLIPAFTFANPLSSYFDPLFSKEPPFEQRIPYPLGHHDMSNAEQLPPYLHGIDLTDGQIKNIKALVQVTQDGMQAKQKIGIEYRLYIQKQIFSHTYSDEKIADMIKKFSDQHEENEINMAKLDHAIFELLTPSQQQQVQSNLTTVSERLKKWK